MERLASSKYNVFHTRGQGRTLKTPAGVADLPPATAPSNAHDSFLIGGPKPAQPDATTPAGNHDGKIVSQIYSWISFDARTCAVNSHCCCQEEETVMIASRQADRRRSFAEVIGVFMQTSRAHDAVFACPMTTTALSQALHPDYTFNVCV